MDGKMMTVTPKMVLVAGLTISITFSESVLRASSRQCVVNDLSSVGSVETVSYDCIVVRACWLMRVLTVLCVGSAWCEPGVTPV